MNIPLRGNGETYRRQAAPRWLCRSSTLQASGGAEIIMLQIKEWTFLSRAAEKHTELVLIDVLSFPQSTYPSSELSRAISSVGDDCWSQRCESEAWEHQRWARVMTCSVTALLARCQCHWPCQRHRYLRNHVHDVRCTWTHQLGEYSRFLVSSAYRATRAT
jgi:hypothetical protein